MQITDLASIDATGFHLSDYPSFRAYFVAKYQAIYGADVYLEDDSQDGQWISVLAQAVYDTAARDGATYNSFSPTSAQGTGLSRLVKINGLKRQVPSFSTATVTIVGTAGTVITNGVVIDTLQQKWNLPATVTIPGGGTIDVVATAQVVGAIDAAANTITGIFTPTQGWQTVNNAAGATPGSPVETDAELRARQVLSVATPSLTVFDGTQGAVANVTGVTKSRGYENDTDSTDGNGIPKHSICMVVAGGASLDIANAIAVHKTPGCNTYGDTTILVTDAHGMPLNITFQRAVTATIGVQVTIASHTGWSSDYVTLIQQSLAAAINAGKIGDTVLLTKLYTAAYLSGTAPGSTFDVTLLQLQKNGGSYASSNVSLLFSENPVCDPNVNVSVIVT